MITTDSGNRAIRILINRPEELSDMVEAKTLSAYFDELREETLPSLGIEDSQLISIISARLLIERVGERDANYWWDSQVLSDFGQSTLDETVLRTATRLQIDGYENRTESGKRGDR
jgi:hypothetical protein